MLPSILNLTCAKFYVLQILLYSSDDNQNQHLFVLTECEVHLAEHYAMIIFSFCLSVKQLAALS